MYDYEDEPIDGVGFADPGGRSALRASSNSNPRIYPCPTCKAKNVLTRIDVQRHYQCDRCADRDEGRLY
jgi:DNA-directed RNA polymerase subunit RPC12/RpoP